VGAGSWAGGMVGVERAMAQVGRRKCGQTNAQEAKEEVLQLQPCVAKEVAVKWCAVACAVGGQVVRGESQRPG